MRVDVHGDVGVRVAQNSLSRFRVNLLLRNQHRRQRVTKCMKSSPAPLGSINDPVLNETGPNVVLYKLAS